MDIRGVVEHGDKRGSQMGFPTANISIKGLDDINPGVYAGKTSIDGKEYVCAVHIHAHKPLLEAHVLDFQGDLYGRGLALELRKNIREVRKFENEEDLVEQIRKDIEIIRQYFEREI